MEIFIILLQLLLLFDASEGKIFNHTVHMPRRPCVGDWCDPSHEPYPNIVSVMTGYNIVKGNPFVDGVTYDPGFATSYIFQPTYRTPDGRYALYEGVAVRELMQCSLTMKTDFVTTVDAYREAISNKASQGTDFASNLETEVSAEVEGIGIKTKVPPLVTASFGSSSAMKDIQGFFTKKQGVATFNEATCSSYTVHLSKYDPPPFTVGMVNALKRLQKVIKKPEEQRREFTSFISDFGTHFIEEVTMGSRLSISRKYSMSEYASSSDSAITKCNQAKFGVNFFGVQVGHSEESCKAVAGTGNSESIEGFTREQVTSYGSKPAESLIDWSQQKFDSPLPIRMALSPILNIFSSAHMEKRHPDIDYKAILRFMAPLYYNYCEDNKESLGIESCDDSKNKGCGWNDNCIPRQQVCMNDKHASDGYYCCDLKCNKQPCDNGGTCTDIPETCDYKCSCKHPWTGRQCKDRVVDKTILEKEVKSFMNQHRSSSNDDFRNIMFHFLRDKYSNYNFVVDSYTEVSGNDVHGDDGPGHIFNFRNYGRNLVIGWARSDSPVPSRSKLDSIKKDLYKYIQYKGCHSTSESASFYEKVTSYGYPVSLVHVVRFGSGLRSVGSGTWLFKNFACGRWCSWGKCHDDESSLVVLFGKP